MTTFTDLHRSDFDFNTLATPFGGFGDILWRDHAGNDVLWLMNINSPSSVATLPDVTPGWHVKAAAEFDLPELGFNSDDILWQNDNGALALWRMNGTTIVINHALPNPGPTWHVVGDYDFNGDLKDDIFFQHDSGALAIWTISNAQFGTVSGMFAGIQNPGPTWHVVGTGDTDGDQRAGILWQNDSGALAIWENPVFVNMPFIGDIFIFNTVAALPTVDASWHVKGMADVSGNGRADVVFQNDSGAVAIWEMGGAGGTTINAANLVNINPGPTWHIAGLRDMDGDGHADILFQNDNGAAAIWENYQSLGGGSATFNGLLAVTPNPNPNGHVWDLL